MLSAVQVPSVTNDHAAEASTPGVSAVTECHAQTVVISTPPRQTAAAAAAPQPSQSKDNKKFTVTDSEEKYFLHTQAKLGRSLVPHRPYCKREFKKFTGPRAAKNGGSRAAAMWRAVLSSGSLPPSLYVFIFILQFPLEIYCHSHEKATPHSLSIISPKFAIQHAQRFNLMLLFNCVNE